MAFIASNAPDLHHGLEHACIELDPKRFKCFFERVALQVRRTSCFSCNSDNHREAAIGSWALVCKERFWRRIGENLSPDSLRMPAAKSTTTPNVRCWVWFKNNPLKEDGSWKGGWYGAPSVIGGIRIEHHDYVPCRVPEWRVVFSEPADLEASPSIPENAEWKLFPTEPQT